MPVMVARGAASVKASIEDRRQTLRQAGLDRFICAGHQHDMMIYKIFREAEWADLRAKGETRGAPIDLADGYVHFSTAEQAAETAAKHFAGQDGLMLLGIDAETLGDDLKWEVSRGDQLFPHLYRVLRMADVAWAQPLPLADGIHQFPAGLADSAS